MREPVGIDGYGEECLSYYTKFFMVRCGILAVSGAGGEGLLRGSGCSFKIIWFGRRVGLLASVKQWLVKGSSLTRNKGPVLSYRYQE